MSVDYRKMVTMPIRDTVNDGAIYCLVDIYGVEPRDLQVIGGSVGFAPIHKAVKRLGLPTYRFSASIKDIPLGGPY